LFHRFNDARNARVDHPFTSEILPDVLPLSLKISSHFRQRLLLLREAADILKAGLAGKLGAFFQTVAGKSLIYEPARHDFEMIRYPVIVQNSSFTRPLFVYMHIIRYSCFNYETASRLALDAPRGRGRIGSPRSN